MKKMLKTILAALAACCSVLLAGCASKAPPPATFDLGPLHGSPAAVPAAKALPAISMAQVSSPAWLDSPMIFFRLNYANDQQPRPYAHSRWVMPPAQLVAQRLKSRIAQAGGAVFSASASAANVPVLRIEIDDFIQTFGSPAQSAAQVSLRAALFNGRNLVAQKAFAQQLPAPSADAEGGVKALTAATDAVIAEMLAWLATVPSASK